MAGTLYDIGIVTPIANIAAALTAKYGAYANPGNLNGYEELYKDTEYLIFRCAAIADDKVIKIRWYNSITLHHLWGTAWSSGTSVTGETHFGCSDGNNSREHSTVHLILHDETYFLVTATIYSFGEAGSMVVVIGELSNGGHGVAGFASCSNVASVNDSRMYCLDDGILYFPQFLPGNCQTPAGKLYEQNVNFVISTANLVLLDLANELVYFLNITNVGHQSGVQNPIIGTDFIMSGGYLKLDGHPTMGSNMIFPSALMCKFTP